MIVSDPTRTPLLEHAIMRPFLATVVRDDTSTPASLLSNVTVKLPSSAVIKLLSEEIVTVWVVCGLEITVHCRLVAVAEQVSVITSSAHGLLA